MKAFILIQAEPGTDGHLAGEVSKLDGVRWVERVSGPFDLIAEAEWEDAGAVVPRIGEMSGVLHALTSLVLEEPEPQGPAAHDVPEIAAAG